MIHVAVEQCRDGDVLVVAPTAPSRRRLLRRPARHRAAGAGRPRPGDRRRLPRRRRAARDGLPGLVAVRLGRGHGQGHARRRQRADRRAPASIVEPGDVIVADDDGVVVVPAAAGGRGARGVPARARTRRRRRGRATPPASSASTSTTCAPLLERAGVTLRRPRDHRKEQRAVIIDMPRPLHHRPRPAPGVPRRPAGRPSTAGGAGPAGARSSRRRDPRERREQPAAGAARARRRPDDLLARRPPAWSTTSGPGGRRGLGAGLQRPGRTGSAELYPRALRAGGPAAADARRLDLDELPSPSCAAASSELGFVGVQPQPRPVGRLLDLAADDRRVLVPGLRGDGGARRAGDDPRLDRRATPTSTRSARTTSTPTPASSCSCSRATCSTRFPTLRLVIPHGGGAVPYHWGRFRGLADAHRPAATAEHLLRNVFFDTCVYHQRRHRPAARVIPAGQRAVRLRDARRGPRRRPGDRHRRGTTPCATSRPRACRTTTVPRS